MKKAPEVARFLLEELERADIVPPSAVIASPLVRMGSEVKFIDYATDKIEQVRLVYPEEADESRGWISVLTPIGSALLGLGPGQSIECCFAGGKTLRLGVLRHSSTFRREGWRGAAALAHDIVTRNGSAGPIAARS